MPQDDRDALEVLRAELNFVTKGGYGRSPRELWRTVLPLEHSPTCMNYDRKDNPAPCAECLLMQFVPAEKLAESSMPGTFRSRPQAKRCSSFTGEPRSKTSKRH